MRSKGTLLSILMLSLALVSSLTTATARATNDIVVQSVAETEVEVVNRAGRKEKKREPVKLAVPGSTVIYTTRFTNNGAQPAGDVVIDNPIPQNTVFVVGSAFGARTAISYSVDGGKSYDAPARLRVRGANGVERAAEPRDYTHIRWRYQGELAPGQRGEVGFRVVIK